MPKQLNDSKVFDFIGIQDNVDPLSEKRSVLKCTNLEPHVKPGIFTLRPPYQLRYKKPTDIYERINSEEFVSFDNFYEKTAREQAEVTVLISKGEIRAPLINNSRISDYTFRSINIYVRPHWNGYRWADSWMWLNEPIITKVTAAPDSTYKNKIQVYGNYEDMLQWTLINVTKDKTVPYAILKSKANGSNTDVWISVFNPNFEIDDNIVLMRNYIPLKYLIQNYNVLREEISFHRILSRMRIGFGGKEGRIGLGIDYVKNILRLAEYNYTDTDPLMEPKLFAQTNKLVCQPYAAFNEDKKDYKLEVAAVAGGTFEAGKYYFRMTASYSADEFLVVEEERVVDETSYFIISPKIRLGSLSRRLTAIKVYFSSTGNDYYLWKEFVLASNNTDIASPDFALNNDGYLEAVVNITGNELYAEDSAVSAADTNSIGSWTARTELGNFFLTVIPENNYAINLQITAGDWNPFLELPVSALLHPLYAGKSYTITINHKSTNMGGTFRGVNIYLEKGISPNVRSYYLGRVDYTSAFETYTLTITIPDDLDGDPIEYIISLRPYYDSRTSVTRHYTVESFSILEEGTQTLNAASELGVLMDLELGYTPTFNLVRDWMNATYLNGRTYVAPAFIEKRYETFVFGSQVKGDGSNMHDVIPAGGTVFPVDEYRGEIITGMVVMHNLNIAIFTDGGLIVLDPDTGNTREVARGYGLRAKGSIMVFRGSIIYASDDDFIQISAATGYEAIPKSTNSVRDIYNKISNKLKLHACFDRFGTYHVALGEDETYREILLTDRGWIDQDREHYPQVFRNGLGGRVWFMNNGDIYAMPYSEEEFVGYADLYGDYRSGW